MHLGFPDPKKLIALIWKNLTDQILLTGQDTYRQIFH